MSKRKNTSSFEFSASLDVSVENGGGERICKRRKSREEISITTQGGAVTTTDSALTDDSNVQIMAAVMEEDEIKATATTEGQQQQQQTSPAANDDNNRSDNRSSVKSQQDANRVVSSTASQNKQIRYDRQLRLWGDHGQALLESAHVCLLNVTAVGTEILKSLILAGVGAYTIIDGNSVTSADLGSNFFLDSASIGQNRAKVACELLQELNSDVRGNYVVSTPDGCVSQHGSPSVFDQFTVVIGTNLSRKTLSLLGGYLFKRGIPFVVCHCNGLVGYLRLLMKEHAVIESHPDNPLPNFMLDKPFPELLSLVSSIDLDSLNHKDHSHTPYLILLLKALEIWRVNKMGDKESSSSFPRTYKEKKEVKQVLLSMRKPDEKGILDEENFDEAMNAVNVAFMETTVPKNVLDIIGMESAKTLTEASSNFWILCHALGRFVANYGRLPVRGSLPDMISDSERYIKLQSVFLRKAEEDASVVHTYASEACKPLTNRAISTADARFFCKNAAFLRLITSDSSSRAQTDCIVGGDVVELNGSTNDLSDEEFNSAVWYLVLVEAEAFFDEKGRYPGSAAGVDGGGNADESYYENDKNELAARIKQRAKELLGNEEKLSRLRSAAEEICRYGGSELHAMASFLGGVTAHEVIKLITYQYVPANNTYIFDGNTGQGSVLRLK